MQSKSIIHDQTGQFKQNLDHLDRGQFAVGMLELTPGIQTLSFSPEILLSWTGLADLPPPCRHLLRKWQISDFKSQISQSGGGKSPQPRPSGFPRVKRKGATGPMRHGLGASAPARCRLAGAPGGVFRPICGGSAACGAHPKPQLGSAFARHPRPLRLRLRSLAPPRPLRSWILPVRSSNPRCHTF